MRFYSRLLKVASAALLIVTMTSCSSKKDFILSPVVPAAKGHVLIDKDKNENYSIRIQIMNLPEAVRVTSHNSTYVVWMETSDDTKKIGQIVSSKGLLSKTPKASLETRTAFKPTKIFITAEKNGNLQHPESEVVISTERF